MENYKAVAGLDIGNGYVKGLMKIWQEDKDKNGVKPFGIDILSGAAYVTNPNDIKVKESELKNFMPDILNNLDVSIDSPLIHDPARRFFGKRAISSGLSLEEFDVFSHISKAQQDLSGILVLGVLAGESVRAYYEEHEKLPSDILRVTLNLALSLPISEYKLYRKLYRESFMAGSHMVSVHNFETPVRVELIITDVQVTAEGASGQYAITAKGEPLMDMMLKDVRRLGETLEGITAKDILMAKNTVGIDIGEGTVNFPVFLDGKFNTDASLTLNKGYGNVLENALERLARLGFQYNNRKSLADFMQTTPTNITRVRYNKALNIINEEITAFAKEASQEFRKVIARTGAFLEVVYVYGGGATPVKEIFYPMIINIAKTFGGGETAYPILYLDSRYSRFLNREGLYMIADKISDTIDDKKDA